MRPHRARSSILALAVLALTGCSTLPQGSTQSEAAAALEWAEHLCEGRYTEAHALTSDEARIDSEVHAEVAEGLAEVDGLAADRLAVLADEGTEVAPRLEVEQVETASGGRAVVRLSGTCWGEELRLMVDVIEQDDGWRVDAGLPAWYVPELFEFDDYTNFAALGLEGGVRLAQGDSDNDLWILLPGRHDVEVPAHFLVGGPWHTEVTVTGLLGIERGVLPEISTDPIVSAFTDLVTACGEVCLVTSGPDEAPEFTVPVMIEPVSGAEATYSGDAVLIRPTGASPAFYDTRPDSWGRESPDTATAGLGNVALDRVDLMCATGEQCTITVADELDGPDSVRRLWFVDTGDRVAVSGLD